MKNYILISISFFSFVLILTSCAEEVLVDRLRDDGHPCKIPIWILPPSGSYGNRVGYPMYEVKQVSFDQDYILHSFKGYNIFSRKDKSVSYVPIYELMYLDTNIRSINGKLTEYMCPYNKNKILFWVQFFGSDRKEYRHWFIYDHSTKTATKVTPLPYREKGIKIPDSTAPQLLQWLNNSTEGNDLFYTTNGVYCVQKNQIIDSFTYSNVFSVSPNGKYKWHVYSNHSGMQHQYTGYYLNGVEINGIKIYGSSLFQTNSDNIVWSPDSKYMSIIAFKDEEFAAARGSKELIVIDVEQTILQRKIVRVKSISFRDTYCAYRIGQQGMFLNDNKFAVSWSYNSNDQGIIYEINLDSLDKKVLVDF